MTTWLNALRSVELTLSELKGSFALFAVFLPADSGDQWDLVISAPWARRDDRRVLHLVTEELSKNISPLDRLRLSRVVVVETWHPDVQKINSAINREHGLVETSNEEYFGYQAQRAYIITSRDCWSFIKQLFPSNADFVFSPHNGDLIVRISWHLNDEVTRRYKRSKNIVIRISREFLDDYLYVDNPRRLEAETRLTGYVVEQLKTFDPRHESPNYSTTPREEWHVTTDLFRNQPAALR